MKILNNIEATGKSEQPVPVNLYVREVVYIEVCKSTIFVCYFCQINFRNSNICFLIK